MRIILALVAVVFGGCADVDGDTEIELGEIEGFPWSCSEQGNGICGPRWEPSAACQVDPTTC